MGIKAQKRKETYRYLTFGLLTLLFSTSLAVTAYSGQFEDAVAAYKRGDYETANKLMKPLAQEGIPEAQFNLGVMYAKGQGVPQDNVLAYMWFSLAAARFPATEGKKRDMCVRNRDRVALKMTLEQIAEAQQLAREWKPKKEGKW